MHTHQTGDSSTSGSEQRPASAKNLSRNGVRGITNQNDHDLSINHRDSNVPQSRSSDILSDYNPSVLSTRNMESLAFNPTPAGRLMPYMNPGFHGIGSQISQNYANSLGILNAETYDDGRGAVRAREASEMRLKHNEPTMPFGITSGPKITLDPELRTDSEELDAGSRRRKKPRIENHSGDDDEEARKKARGRPRVDTKDETAADVRLVRSLKFRSWIDCGMGLWKGPLLLWLLKEVVVTSLEYSLTVRSVGERKFEWPREPIAIVKKPRYLLWKSGSKI